MTVKPFYIAPLLVLTTLALVFDSCEAPQYYENAKKDFPAVVRVSSNGGMGSGVIITREGYVLTTKNMIGDNQSATVVLGSGARYQASVAAADDARDLAILRLPENPEGYPFAALGNPAESDTLRLGSQVIAMGYPDDNKTVQVTLSAGKICGFPTVNSVSFLQSDVKINPGSSGGPMTNSEGEIIGIISSRYTDANKACAIFATAVSEAKPLLDSLTAVKQAVVAVPAENTTSVSSLPSSSLDYLAPDFSLPSADQRQFSLSSFRGKKVLLVFLSTTCEACLKTMQCLLPVYAAWPKDEFEMVFVITGGQFDDVQKWIDLYHVECPVLLDSDGIVLTQYQVKQYPTLYFLTADGHVKIIKSGLIDDCSKQLDTLLRQY